MYAVLDYYILLQAIGHYRGDHTLQTLPQAEAVCGLETSLRFPSEIR